MCQVSKSNSSFPPPHPPPLSNAPSIPGFTSPPRARTRGERNKKRRIRNKNKKNKNKNKGKNCPATPHTAPHYAIASKLARFLYSASQTRSSDHQTVCMYSVHVHKKYHLLTYLHTCIKSSQVLLRTYIRTWYGMYVPRITKAKKQNPTHAPHTSTSTSTITATASPKPKGKERKSEKRKEKERKRRRKEKKVGQGWTARWAGLHRHRGGFCGLQVLLCLCLLISGGRIGGFGM